MAAFIDCSDWLARTYSLRRGRACSWSKKAEKWEGRDARGAIVAPLASTPLYFLSFGWPRIDLREGS